MRAFKFNGKRFALMTLISGLMIYAGVSFLPQNQDAIDTQRDSEKSAELRALEEADAAVRQAKEVLGVPAGANAAEAESNQDPKFKEYMAKVEGDSKKVEAIRRRLEEKQELIEDLNARFKSLVKPPESDNQALADYHSRETEYQQEMAQILGNLDEDVLQ